MSAKEALVAYGYAMREDGRYVQPGRRSQEWVEAGDAPGFWYRFDDGELMQHSLKPDMEHEDGLNHVDHAEHFNFLWPDAEVEQIYTVGASARYADPSPPIEE